MHNAAISFGARIALKQDKDTNFGEPEQLENFVQELKWLCLFKHEHIIPFYGLFVYSLAAADGAVYHRYFFAMKQAKSTISEVLTEPYPYVTLADRYRWAREVTAAVEYLHGKAYVHRDVKPDNILVDGEGTSYLTDFGQSRRVSTVTKHSTVMQITVEFAPPEVLSQDFKYFSRATKHAKKLQQSELRELPAPNYLADLYHHAGTADEPFLSGDEIQLRCRRDEQVKQSVLLAYGIYSLALTINCFFTSQTHPFQMYSVEQMMHGAINGYLRPSIYEFLSPAFKDLIRKMWSKDPKERPQAA